MKPVELAQAVADAKAPAAGIPRGMKPAGLIWGVVASIQAGPPPTLTCTLAGSSSNVAGIKFLSTYNPTAADTVLIAQVGSDLVVMGILATLAPSSKSAHAATANTDTTASLTYVTAASAPVVTVTTGVRVAVAVAGQIATNTAGDGGAISWKCSGATTIAAADINAAFYYGAGQPNIRIGVTVVTTVTAGSNVFTEQIRAVAGGTTSIVTRALDVIVL